MVWRDAFDGLLADAVAVWRHNRVSQTVVLREQPVWPEGMDLATTRLVVVTEFVEAPEAALNPRLAPAAPGLPDREDHVTITLKDVLILQGHAYKTEGGAAVILGARKAAERGVAVWKTWSPKAGERALVAGVARHGFVGQRKAFRGADAEKKQCAASVEPGRAAFAIDDSGWRAIGPAAGSRSAWSSRFGAWVAPTAG